MHRHLHKKIALPAIFFLDPNPDPKGSLSTPIIGHNRTHFDYNPKCREASGSSADIFHAALPSGETGIVKAIAIDGYTQQADGLREARIQKKLTGSGFTCDVIDTADTGRDQYSHFLILMELAKGEELFTIAEKLATQSVLSKRLPDEASAPIRQDILVVKTYLTQQLVLGLQMLHANDVFHLDYGLENLVVSPEGQLKIVDFGNAQEGDEPLSLANISNKIKSGWPREVGIKLGFPPKPSQIDTCFVGINIYRLFVGEFGPDSLPRNMRHVRDGNPAKPVLDLIFNAADIPSLDQVAESLLITDSDTCISPKQYARAYARLFNC
ncbi:MAG: serine/threonine protein kinase [Candidatus Marinamargulisbacteria bacterium]|jgi:serine/threonine protein kinase